MIDQKCLKITCWIFFVIHFAFIIVFHGIFNICLSKCDFVLDILLLISLNSIGLFMTLSQPHSSKNSSGIDYTFLKSAIVFSFVNLIFIILSIVYISINFIFNEPPNQQDKQKEKEKNDSPIQKSFFEVYYEKEIQIGYLILIIIFKVLESIPLFLLLYVYKSRKNNIRNLSIISNN